MSRPKCDASAYYWARVVGGPAAVPYCTLKPGDIFRFPGHEDRNVKLRGNRYRTAAGSRWWISGRLTAVIPEREEVSCGSSPPKPSSDSPAKG